MSARGVCELTLETPDPRALAEFYAQVFDFPVLAEEDDRIWLGCGERTRLGLWSPGEKEFGDRGGRHVHFAFSVNHGELVTVLDRCARWASSTAGRSATRAVTSRCTSRTRRATSSRRGTSSRTATAPPRASPPSRNRRVPAWIPG